ncbi:hypothetical protein HOY34_13630 [Xinfangfangia sp. D13-10-4-6]|uniref:hypothetical protein n=1 Tax=Pseudogemmobacter hezensis TaxID=2737662 RepID=UPI001551BEE1|nr:hypothetical protein [Pseudogemmobacter hezensis]NPD16237.1 hypothetical protein [Pseudogemmobacter hezensis]
MSSTASAKPITTARTRPSRGILRRIPVLGPVFDRVRREIAQDINNIFWLIPVLVLGMVLAIQTWGLAALAMAALAMVPVMFAFFVAISWP